MLHTLAVSVEGAHPEATLLGLGSEGWVYVGLTIFLLLAIFVAKAPQKIVEALDGRIAETRRQLDEAKAIRAEAEALLAEARARAQASAGDAAAIVAQAEADAQAMLAKAEHDAAELIARRSKMAEDKIAAAERGAIADVRAQAARAAAQAAARLIGERHGADADKPLVDRAIAGIARPN
ncbi:MAG: hypothetical protein A4S12_08990 [Proteobacteria bacterium SG_bin5]|nr:hypothetical protein [Sphingomonas sp.]OQW41139.1 MAG: hypothetical protein A4S12_08990 [Proteobacteria bacterium SG_bin5]